MSKINDLSGKVFGMLTVVKYHSSNQKTGKAMFLCKCECGKETVAMGNSLSRGNTTSCGCYRPIQIKDYSGQIFGRLLVVSHHSIDGTNSKFLCRCDCGNEIITFGFNLKKGQTKSCGCLRREMVMGKRSLAGDSQSKEYTCWISLRDRVKNSMYYIKRGITVCESYKHSFLPFQKDMGKQPEGMNSVDRKDNNGNYSCGKCAECLRNGWTMNVQWANAKMQANNTSRNNWVTYKGQTKTLSEWEAISGIKRSTLHHRIFKFGWPIEKSLTSKGKLANKPISTIFESQNNF